MLFGFFSPSDSLHLCFCPSAGPGGPSTSPTLEQIPQACRVSSKEKFSLHKEWGPCVLAHSQPAAAGAESLCHVPGWGSLGQQLAGQPSCTSAPFPSVGTAAGWRRAAVVLPPALLQGERGWVSWSPMPLRPPIIMPSPTIPRQPSDLPNGQQNAPNPTAGPQATTSPQIPHLGL